MDSQSRFLVFGLGKSGVAAVKLLKEKGYDVVMFDGNDKLDMENIRIKNPELEGVPIVLGTISEELMSTLDYVVLSPGVPTDLPIVNAMKANGIPIWGEIELAYRLGKGRVAAITGTNGKTTTTSLLGLIMGLYFPDTKVVGNIGIPYTSVVTETTDDSVIVAEISSFQLETVHEFAPKASAILNITPDHLNRHHTMEAYIAAKETITKNQTEEDTCVLNYEDEVLRAFGKTLNCRVVYFSSQRSLDEGLFVEDGVIWWKRSRESDEIEKILPVDELNILGDHNYENAMAAIAMADAFSVPPEIIRKGLREFTAVEHRIEFFCNKNGVDYYNDSKGTNPDAAIKGIKAMNRPTYLIGGGYDKQSEYDEWIESFDGKVRKLVLIGQTKEKIAACCDRHGFKDYLLFETFEQAIDYCYENAKEGEAVLLSPACASWGMFPNYEERGRIFKEYVRSLK